MIQERPRDRKGPGTGWSASVLADRVSVLAANVWRQRTRGYSEC